MIICTVDKQYFKMLWSGIRYSLVYVTLKTVVGEIAKLERLKSEKFELESSIPSWKVDNRNF